MIDGVIIQDLNQIIDERGRIMHMLRSDNPLFERFGEIYFSEILPGVIKAWKFYKEMTQHFAVIIGKIRVVIYDDRANSSTYQNLEILETGRDNYKLIKIPPQLYYGFKCISNTPSVIANLADMPHSKGESKLIDQDEECIPYQW